MSAEDMAPVFAWCRELDEAANRAKYPPLPDEVEARVAIARAARGLGERLRRGKPTSWRRP